MKNTKRIVTLLLLVGILLLGGSTLLAEDKPYEIKWYFVGNGQQPDVRLIEDAASKYIQKNGLNATLKLLCYTWGYEYDNRMRMITASGEPFDICFTSAWANYYKMNITNGAFLDITSLWKKYAPKTRAQLHPAFITGTQIDGRNYAIPANKELAHQWGLIFNKNFVDKYKFDLSTIKTLADVEPMLRVIHEKEPSVVGLHNTYRENASRILDWDKLEDQVPAGLYNDSKDMKIFNTLETKEYKDYIKLMHKWYLAGYIPPADNMASDFVSDRKSGKIFCWLDSLKPFCAEERAASYGFPCVQVKLTKPVIQTRDCEGSMQAISKTCKNPALVLRFLELFNTDKYLNNLINFGIEGRHYVKVDQNTIEFLPRITGQNSGYNPGAPWIFGNQYLNYLWKGENPKKWEVFKQFNASSISAKTLGFNYDNSAVKNEIASCTALRPYLDLLDCGTGDPKTLPDIIAKYKAAGLDKIIKEQQRQLDAWLAKRK